MKSLVLIFSFIIIGAFFAQANPVIQKDWVSGQWSCVGQNATQMFVSLRLTSSEQSSTLEILTDYLPEQITLDGKNHILSVEGVGNDKSFVSYVGAYDFSKKTIDIDFDIIYKSATEAHLVQSYSPSEDKLKIQYSFKDNSQPSNLFICSRSN